MAAVYDILRGKAGLRYRRNKVLVSKDSVPEKVLEALTETNIVDENGLVIVEEREPQVEKESEANETPAQDPPVEEVAKTSEVEEPQGAVDEAPAPQVEKEEAPVPRKRATPTRAFNSKTPQTDTGFGFPRKAGKTVDIFDGKTPHTHIKLVGGHAVPLSADNFAAKSDNEIIDRLRELGYQIIDFNSFDKGSYEEEPQDDGDLKDD